MSTNCIHAAMYLHKQICIHEQFREKVEESDSGHARPSIVSAVSSSHDECVCARAHFEHPRLNVTFN